MTVVPNYAPRFSITTELRVPAGSEPNLDLRFPDLGRWLLLSFLNLQSYCTIQTWQVSVKCATANVVTWWDSN